MFLLSELVFICENYLDFCKTNKKNVQDKDNDVFCENGTNKVRGLRNAWADDWSNGVKKSRPTSAGEVGREKL